MVTANFLTEDTYLGSINEPLTLNRYNYCISSYPNYEDPSGNSHNEYHPQAEMMEYMYWLTGDEKYSGLAEELYGQQIEMEYYEASTSAGVVDSVLAAAANTVIFTYNVVAMGTNLTQSLFARELGSEYGDRRYEYPVPLIPWDTADNYLENNASKVWNMESYHIGRCGGDVLVTAGSLAVGVYGIYNGLKNVTAGIRFGSNGGKLFALVNSQAAGGTLGLVTSGTKALNVVGTALADAVAFDALTDFRDRVSRIGGEKGARGDINTSWNNPDGSMNYPPNNGAVPGTEVDMTLKPGDTFGRYGKIGEKSNFVTQTGADASKLSLPPNTDPAIYQEFEVIKEIPGTIQAEILPWGDSVGGGIQYELPMPIMQLLKEGYIIPK